MNKKTVVRKIRFLARKARTMHEQKLDNHEIKTFQIQFDEMETFEHTRKKPISIAVAVECYYDKKTQKYRTGRIIDAVAAQMYYKSLNAPKAKELYGIREDRSAEARSYVAESMKKAAIVPDIKILTDGKTDYKTLFADMMPESKHIIISRADNSGTELDKMFSLNHTCSRIRHDMSRMARQSWVTTKKIKGLQDHLDLYIAYFNGYCL
jgi:hypothetical protein